MSYILDALRKSEAARRSREAPDLLRQTAAPLQPAPAVRARTYAGRPAWALAALGVSALAVALWLRFAPAGDAPADASDPSRDEPARSAGTDDARGIDTVPVDTGPIDTSPAGTRQPVSDADDVPGLDPGRPPGVIPGMAPAIGPAPAVVPPPAPSPPPSAAPAADPRESAMRGPTTASSAPAAPAATRPAAEPSAAAASRPAAVVSAAPPNADGRPVALADIAPDLRRQLPPLRMSMHLWNEAPERRLLVLDGQRLRQGDVIGEVVVERIDRDGAVLAWRGARILLPVE